MSGTSPAEVRKHFSKDDTHSKARFEARYTFQTLFETRETILVSLYRTFHAEHIANRAQ